MKMRRIEVLRDGWKKVRIKELLRDEIFRAYDDQTYLGAYCVIKTGETKVVVRKVN